MKPKIKERQSNKSSTRLLTILECLSQSPMAMKLNDIADETELSQSTVLRYLYALKDSNYIYQDEDTSKYALTWKVCQLTEHMNNYISLRNIANPFINKIASNLDLGSCVVVEQDHECLYLDYVGAPNLLTPQRIGNIAPMHATGSGKVLLSQYSDAQFDEYINKKGLIKCTDFTITDPEILRRELVQIREQDFGMDEEECEIGMRCISIPLRDYNGKIVASMSVFGGLEEMTDTRIQKQIYPILRSSTDIISKRLGYDAK